jgi:serine/threonine protein kinase
MQQYQFSDVNPKLATACRSPADAEPEMVNDNTYMQAADIGSSGILLLAIVAGFRPFDGERSSVDIEVKDSAFMTP